MSIWFFIVLVIGIVYALNRLTTTTDLPVSTRLAQAREIAEGRGRRPVATDPPAAADGGSAAVGRPAGPSAEQRVVRRYCSTRPVGRRTAARTRHVTRY